MRGRAALSLAGLLAFVGFVALGVWQVERRAWKHTLIARVEQRLGAPPVTPPPPALWPSIGGDDAYRRLRLDGHWLEGRDALVQAVTDLGPGWWVLTPLSTARGVILVNRGFVASRVAPPPPPGAATITGLLRATEPGGGFLRRNDPGHDRWYSRDTAAIAAARRLGTVAPFFVDADAASSRRGGPVGGLTVVRFSDNHLVYALTWFALAAMTLVFLWTLWRPGRGSR